MGIRVVTEKELHWVNEQYQKIDFVPSTLENEIIAIVTYQDRFAGIGRMVYLNEEEAEILKSQFVISSCLHLMFQIGTSNFLFLFCLIET